GSMANPVVQIDLSPEEMIEAKRAKVALQVEEDHLAEIVRRTEAANFAVALAERNRKNPPRHHGRNVVCSMLFKGEFDAWHRMKFRDAQCLAPRGAPHCTGALNMDYPLSENLRALFKVGSGFDEPQDDDDATDEEQAKVDSDLESDDDEDDFEMGEVAFAPTDDEY
ncbi:hypothetical protein HAX54_026576, partial [Datura stramonium]|nr:hypothetical protein [Datura stramonium]